MKRSGSIRRRSGLSPVSAKRRVQLDAQAVAYDEVDRRSRGLCEANVPGVCPLGSHRAGHRHHVLPRSKTTEHNAADILHVCATAHDYIHAHPAWARVVGLLR